jgi:hypothetical protein
MRESALVMSTGKRFESVRRLSSFCFSAPLREEAGFDALNAELVEVARETMQPAYFSLGCALIRLRRAAEGESNPRTS